MKIQYWKLTSSVLLLTLLTACEGSSSGGGGGGTSTSASRLQAIASAGGTSEPTDVTNPASLQQDINSVMGSPGSEPVPVNTGDTALDVINRAAGQ